MRCGGRRVVPGSQTHGLIESASREAPTGYVIRKIGQQTLSALVGEGGLEALVGPAGSVALMHCNIVHGSANNVGPRRRSALRHTAMHTFVREHTVGAFKRTLLKTRAAAAAAAAVLVLLQSHLLSELQRGLKCVLRNGG